MNSVRIEFFKEIIKEKAVFLEEIMKKTNFCDEFLLNGVEITQNT